MYKAVSRCELLREAVIFESEIGLLASADYPDEHKQISFCSLIRLKRPGDSGSVSWMRHAAADHIQSGVGDVRNNGFRRSTPEGSPGEALLISDNAVV